MSQTHAQRLRESHLARFKGAENPRLFSCPGRINLIGEHIDYNGGHVLPAAIDKRIFLCVSRNNDGMIRFSDLSFGAAWEIPLEFLEHRDPTVDRFWLYPFGAVKLSGNGISTGMDLSYSSDIPLGAGVSSSAAITTVTLYALDALSGRKTDTAEMARKGQRVEREFAGVSCGIMDQFAVIHGKRHHAMLLDTRDLSCRYVRIDTRFVHFILVNSGIKHSLRQTGYNDRRRDCENALARLWESGAPIEHLCDMGMADFNRWSGVLNATEHKRAMHAVSENERAVAFFNAIRERDFEGSGELLYASHESLRDRYEVSIPEMDLMVEWTRGMDGVFGARMMGGGFGGCTINMVRADRTGEFKAAMCGLFRSAFGKDPEMIECTIDDGVREEAL